ncbi:MAG: 1-acyl-sn-glycerol-3-phosphate acyltransferase [Ktedonobacteraceae bacterium]|nr:1-acyl-sn-glycerol-3-phosphate acyltransferase [Ktedonobacteraceae bacterium]
MKQEMDPASGQKSRVSKQDEQGASTRREKNLYEPYSTPLVLYNLIRGFAILVLALIARVRLREHYHVPRKGPYIIAPNHLSWTDIPLVPLYIPGKVVYMAKEESFKSKVGWLVRFLGAFPVKRGEGDRQSLRAADDLLKRGKVLVIFPEGTRSKVHALGKGHAGLGMIALRSGAPVIPVAIYGSERVFKSFRPEVTITYGKPIVFKPKGAKITREDINNATEEIMHQIAAMLPERYRGVYRDLAVQAEAPTQDENQP